MLSTRLHATAAVGTGMTRRLAVAAIPGAVLLIADKAPGARQGGPIRGRVEFGIPISARRPTSAAYPGRTSLLRLRPLRSVYQNSTRARKPKTAASRIFAWAFGRKMY